MLMKKIFYQTVFLNKIEAFVNDFKITVPHAHGCMHVIV